MEDMLTMEQIDKALEDLDGLAWRRAANRMLREQDDSHLYPISGRFNVTNRAIRRVREMEYRSGCGCDGLEYLYRVDAEISQIVNSY